MPASRTASAATRRMRCRAPSRVLRAARLRIRDPSKIVVDAVQAAKNSVVTRRIETMHTTYSEITYMASPVPVGKVPHLKPRVR